MATKREPKRVQAVERAAVILKTLIQTGDEMGVSVLSRLVKLPVSTTYRLVTTLERHDLAQQNPVTGRYHVGPLVAGVVAPGANYRALELISLPYMERLRDQIGEDVVLGVPSRGRTQIVSVVPGSGPIKIEQPANSTTPMHCCALGKVLLAHMTSEQRSLIVHGFGLPRLTTKTITTLADLQGEMGRIQAEGIAINDEELIPGMRSLAAPVRDAAGTVVAAVGVRGLAVNLTGHRLGELKEPLLKTAEAISLALGAEAPTQSLQQLPVSA